MGKIIAVTGSHFSGKTIVALKLAEEIYYKSRPIILFVSPDYTEPTLPFIFPNKNKEDLFSLGKILDRAELQKDDILKNTVVTKSMENMGFIGYSAAENKYSYPEVTIDKASSFLELAAGLCDYLIIDCADCQESISIAAVGKADIVINVVTADLKSMCWYASDKNFISKTGNQINVLNIPDKDFYMPDETVKKKLKINYTLPFSLYVKKQALCGTLTETLPDKNFRKAVQGLLKAVI